MTKLDPVESANGAGLAHVGDDMPGIRRIRRGRGFSYIDLNGKVIRDAKERRRIENLVIPPAWTDVWICPDPNGHIQATGRDSKGRKQYRYHPKWQEARNESKFDRMAQFGAALPLIRERIRCDLRLRGLPREKVLAAVVRLLETTCIRIGNAEYARSNDSYGLTTLQDDHVAISGSKMRFEFRGKSGKEHIVEVEDHHLVKIVEHSRNIPGSELFQYLDEEGHARDVTAADVNAYLMEITDEDFTAKDFRTWAGSALCIRALQELGPPTSKREARKNVTQAIKQVAEQLGNTPTVCRKYYVHPVVVEAYLEGWLFEALKRAPGQEAPPSANGLRPEDAAVKTLLQEYPQRKEKGRPAGKHAS